MACLMQPSVELILEALSIGLLLASGGGELEVVECWLVEEARVDTSIRNEHGADPVGYGAIV